MCDACLAHADGNGALAYVRERACAAPPLDHRTDGCGDDVHRGRAGANASSLHENVRADGIGAPALSAATVC